MLHTTWAQDMTLDYVKSDGALERLSLAEVFTRIERFEEAYNPNDCPEYRWGAPEGALSCELLTTRTSAPNGADARSSTLVQGPRLPIGSRGARPSETHRSLLTLAGFTCAAALTAAAVVDPTRAAV